MASAVDVMAGLLVKQLKRLDALDASDPEKIAAECMRAKAVNDTVKGVCALGALHLQAEAARDAAEVGGAFNPGLLFAEVSSAAEQRPGADAARPATRKLEPGSAVSATGRTRVNGCGEFETDEEDGWGREVGA